MHFGEPVDDDRLAALLRPGQGIATVITADAYGGWKAVTNIQAGGGLYAQRIVSRKHYDLEQAKRKALAVAGLSENDAH